MRKRLNYANLEQEDQLYIDVIHNFCAKNYQPPTMMDIVREIDTEKYYVQSILGRLVRTKKITKEGSFYL